MERNERIWSKILIFISVGLFISTIQGCSTSHDLYTSVTVILDNDDITLKSAMPDEDKITDISLLIFDDYGLLEKSIYMKNGVTSCSVNLLKGKTYSIYACANFGYEITTDSVESLKEITFHLAYPDEYREGIPMYAEAADILITENSTINLELKRLMAKISIRLDRSRLSEGVSLNVTGIKIGNCPKNIRVFQNSRARNEDDCFKTGFFLGENQCIPLNRQDINEISEEVSMYMLENMQGRFAEGHITEDTEKVFAENDPRIQVCSYIEIAMDYSSDDRHSTDAPLLYRFYLGGSLNDLDMERNCHYHITISPEDDGLQEDGWRVDKTGISYTGETSLTAYPGEYIVGDIGDRIHIGCILQPDDAPFDVGLSYMEADRSEGIYDYEIDADGHGATLTLKGPGRGMIYMEAGPPIEDAALFVIEVNLPKKEKANEDIGQYMTYCTP